MVQICIKIENKENVNEWSIIELQGELEVKNGESLSSKQLGDLYFTKEGTPMLIIGHHVLYGKIVNLDKPLLVMKRTRKTVSQSFEVDSVDNNVEELENSAQSTDYLVQAIIRKKILFNKRPRPIVVQDMKKK